MPEDVPNCHGYTRAITRRGARGHRGQPAHAGRLRRPRHHRLSHHRLHVRRARPGGARTVLLPTTRAARPCRPSAAGGTASPSCSARPSWATRGAADHDGQEGVAHIGANQSNVPVEMIEAEYPDPHRALWHHARHRRARPLSRRPVPGARLSRARRRGRPQRALRQAQASRRTACTAAGWRTLDEQGASRQRRRRDAPRPAHAHRADAQGRPLPPCHGRRRWLWAIPSIATPIWS